MTARADHAAGLASGDPVRLAAAVDGFEHLGSPLLAAEAAFELAALGVDAAADRAFRLLARLPSPPVTPALRRPEAEWPSVSGTP